MRIICNYLKIAAWAKGVIGFLAWVDCTGSITAIADAHALTTVADEHVPPHKAKNRLVVRNLPDATLITASGELSEISYCNLYWRYADHLVA
jgi:hypothetical protein